MSRAFTLIELLVVVAIIAILAAIAIPNLLEAQTRAKVSRVKADMRTVSLALESYRVDTNHYPPTTFAPTNGNWVALQSLKCFPGALTTPIAYLSGSAPFRDPFRTSRSFAGDELPRQYMYLPSVFYLPPYVNMPSSYRTQVNRFGEWVLHSAGPDTWYQNLPGVQADYEEGGWNRASYDPSNGTVSTGDIYRSQKNPDESHV